MVRKENGGYRLTSQAMKLDEDLSKDSRGGLDI